MKFETPNLTAKNVAKIAELFPGIVTENKVNFDLLRSLLGDEVFTDEAYEFTWVGKRAAIAEAGRPIRKTLRPCVEESKNWDMTENLYIEGDNLDVLKLLQESYLGKVKMIYIDPPYNTGSDKFIYRDRFEMDAYEYEEAINMYDAEGNLNFCENNKTNPRFHSDWCNMLYPCLVLARNLLAPDGLIFFSIDDNEIENLKKMCDEVIGESNFIGMISRLMKSGGNKGRFFSPNIDYVLVYAKDALSATDFKLPLDENVVNKLYNRTETKGLRKGERYRPFGLYQSSLDARPNQRYYIECPDGTFAIPPGITMPKIIADRSKVIPQSDDGCWRWSVDRYLQERENNNVLFVESREGVLIQPNGEKSKWNVYTKIWLSERMDEGQTPTNFISQFESRHSAKELKELGIPFDFPKPTGLIKHLMSFAGIKSNGIILDFFSGSATTAHAVIQLNAEDGGKRRFIMVQLPEICAKGTEAAKAGYSTICEIGKERIRRAGEKIKSEAGLTAQNLDIGFRVLKLDDTNMNDVYYTPGDLKQDRLFTMESNIKPDRTDMDLLYACLLEWGLPLSLPHTHEKIDGFTVHTYNDGDLIACFEERISEKAIRGIAERKPLRAVFRDSGFANSPQKINVFETFKLLAPNTDVRVI
ncbi:MAG: site-specific DNA-methyltransferase [Clostridiales bacterium]|jgi:adenine-specific DNA-methyltransferase|nr:site-specific DNA-methyltransferase [Clostridiales bacterium]